MGKHAGVTPLDAQQRARVNGAVKRAIEGARDVGEYLNEYGLLATPQWAARVRADALKDVIMRLENASPIELTQGKYLTGNWTASDIIAGIVNELRQIEATAREGGWLT